MPSLTRGTAGCVRVPAPGAVCVPDGITSAWMQLLGTSTVQCREGSFRLGRGDWILLDHRSDPHVQTDRLGICMGLHFSADPLAALGEGANPLYAGRGRMCRDDMQIALRLWRRLDVVPDGRVTVRNDLRPLLLLMADLQRDIVTQAHRCPGRSLEQRAGLMARLQVSRLHLEGHPQLDHGVDDLASVAGLPARYFSRVFQAVYGLSPLSFAGRVRLDHAVRLLREGAMTLDQVAVICGFKHRGTLVPALRVHLGLGRMEMLEDRIRSLVSPRYPSPRDRC
ncbi:AraC family transcriptional regulator [Stenotrophomonas sp. TWI1149]|uniref:helix-turn-helix transcriptional regulator n=1 Tax=unclassified Stenotrophomonas TaxID=196198 RepID=UPI0032092796